MTPPANRETLINDMVKRLDEEGISDDEITAFRQYADGQPVAQLRKDSNMF